MKSDRMAEVPFDSSAGFHRWLQRNHGTARELVVVLFKKGSRQPGMTYKDALDEALCFGWIDGVRKNRDAESYTIRFAPRKARSIWSRVNVAHAERLIREGRMQPAGAKAFAVRLPEKTAVYSFEQKTAKLPADLERPFRANAGAWAFFAAQPPGYRRTILWWVISAKQETTRRKRLTQVISQSASRRRVNLLSPYSAG